jgi:hypothetical protein
MQHATNIDLLMQYIELADPRELWKSVFGSAPEFSDVADGPQSSAATALEELLSSLSHEVQPVDLGCPVGYDPVCLDKDGIAKLRKKLMSAVVLHTTALQSKQLLQDSPRTIRDEFSLGVVALVAKPEEVSCVLSDWGIDSDIAKGIFRFSDETGRTGPICLGRGDPEVRVHLRSRSEMQTKCLHLIDQTVASLLTGQKSVLDPDIFTNGDSAVFPAHIRFGDDDERARLNAILEFTGTRVDNDGADMYEVLLHAPFRRTLAQKMADRTLEYFQEVLSTYGFKQAGTCMSARYKDAQAILPVMYRLLGDAEDNLEGVLANDLISHTQVIFPCYPEETPEFVILPPVDRVISEYCANLGGADACIALRNYARVFPPDIGLGPVHPVVVSTETKLSEVRIYIKQIFKNNIVARGNS